MANEIFTRIQLKSDSYANWDAVKSTFKPLPGEICIVEVPTGNAAATTAPTVLFKVGAYKKDASGNNTTELHTFAELPWASALAADVYAWAKKTEAEFITWVNDQIEHPTLSVVDPDAATKKFITKVEVSDHQITITRSDVDWNDVKNAPDFALKSDIPTNHKILQTPVADPTANGKALEFIDTISQNANGEITATKKAVNLDDYALKSEIPTELGVMSIKATGDDEITMAPTTAANGEVTVTAAHAAHAAGSAKTASDKTISGYNGTGSINIPKIVTNAAGHVTEITEETVTITMPPVENSAHTHEVGDGLTQTSNGGINGVVKTELNLDFELKDGNIILKDKTNDKEIAKLEAAELLEDSYLNDVNITGNNLEFTWKMDDGTTKTDSVDLTHLVDAYEGEATDTITVTVEDYTISAVVNANSIKTAHLADGAVTTAKIDDAAVTTSKIADKAVTEAELADEVTEKLNKEWQPVGNYQPAGNYKIIQDEKNYTGSTVKTVTEVKQDTNGVITEVKFEDIAFPEPPKPPKASGSAIIATVADDVVTLKGGVALGEDEDGNHELANNASADIELAKIAKTGSIYDIKEGSVEGTSDADKAIGLKYLIFNCGTASTVI